MQNFQVSLLGPLVVQGAGGPVDLGPVRRQAMFTALLLGGQKPCTKAFLLDAVWGEQKPATGEKVIASYVYALRQALDAPRTRPADSVICGGFGGYWLAADVLAHDAGAAERLGAEAAAAVARDDPRTARDLLISAEGLWRGEPLAQLPGPFAATQRARLAEAHAERVGRRIDLDLELGAAERLVPELRAMSAVDPLGEATAIRLMRALRACDRRTEALAVYDATEALLDEELGVTPGPALQGLRRELLARPARPAAVAPRRNDTWVVRCDLPADPVEFVGRAGELDRLGAGPGAQDTSVRLLDGMGGAGKTTLALRAAHRLAAAYPDGQLFVDLHGHTPGRPPAAATAVLARLLRRVGVPAAEIPEDEDDRAALWRATLVGRRVLLVLDNAASAAQVRPLLPGTAGCRVLITSRERLAELDADTVGVGTLAEADAMALFAALGPPGRDRTDADLRRVARACGCLPLALRIAAARLRNRPSWTVGYLAARLEDGSRPFAELDGADGGVRAAFTDSYASLPPASQAMFRALAALPSGRFDSPAAAAAAGVPLYDGEDLLGGLLEANLLGQDSAGHYHLHDLLRRYSLLCLGDRPRAERLLVHARVLDYYLHTVHTVKQLAGVSSPPVVRAEVVHTPPTERAFADLTDAYAWASAELDNVVALSEQDFDDELADRVWQLVNEWYLFSERNPGLAAYQAVVRRGLEAARRAGSAVGEQTLTARMGTLLTWRGSHRIARRYLERALRGARDLGMADPYLELHARAGIAACDAAGGRHRDVIREFERVYELAERHGYRLMMIGALNSIGLAHHLLGEQHEAIRYFNRSWAVGDPGADGPHLANLGAAHLYLGELDRAERLLCDGLAEFERTRHGEGCAFIGAHLGLLYARRHDAERAVEAHQKSVQQLPAAANRRIQCVIHQRYGDTLLALGRVAAAAAEYEEALRVAEQHELVGEIVDAFAGLGNCCRQAGEPDRARRYWREAAERGAGLELPALTALAEHLGGPAVPSTPDG